MKRFIHIVLISMGCIPFAVGYQINGWMLRHPDSVPPLPLLALLFLMGVTAVSYLARYYTNSTKEVVFYLNFVAGIDFSLIVIQELFLHSYWRNWIGSASQMFYLPLLNLSASLTVWSQTLLPAYFTAFLLMLLSSLAGCRLQNRFISSQRCSRFLSGRPEHK